jgi:hypothetical protein
MPRRLVLVLALLGILYPSSSWAQCSRIGEQICQGGFLYTCQACGSEKCLIFSGEQCRVPVDSLVGTWSGSGHQSGGGLPSSDYPVVMYITRGGGTIEYPSLSCGGSLTELSESGASAQFREHITYGDCIDSGTISVNLVSGKLAWTWTGSGNMSVIAVLERTSRQGCGAVEPRRGEFASRRMRSRRD